MTPSRLQEALAAKERIFGGWVVGPDHHRPRGVRRRPATTTSDSTSSTAISTTPTSRCCCAGSSTSRSPPRCGCRRPTPRPSAGCSTRVPTRSSSPWSNRRNRRPPRWPRPATRLPGCAASGRCGPASASIPAAHEARTSVFAMIETARGTCGTRRDLRRAGAVRRLRRPGGPGDLAGHEARRSVDRTRTVLDAMARIQDCGIGGRPGRRHPRQRGQARKGHGRDWAFG